MDGSQFIHVKSHDNQEEKQEDNSPDAPIKETGCSSSNIVTIITNKVVNMIVTEINNPGMQTAIRLKIIIPVINMIYRELSPYIIALTITICCILLFSLLTFMFFVLFYFKR